MVTSLLPHRPKCAAARLSLVPGLPAAHPSAAAPTAAELDGVSSTLLIPLAARAHGDALFPRHAIGDLHARSTLTTLAAWRGHVPTSLPDRPTIHGVLVRTAIFRRRALDFFARHPRSVGASLGAGLGHYFQWFGPHCSRWIDADLPAVTTLRQRLLPSGDERRLNAAVDLRARGWWQRLGLPAGPYEPPVLLLCEGVLMYLTPDEVSAVLAEIDAHAPPGSRLLFDALHGLAVGRGRLHPSVRHSGAEFRWAPRHGAALPGAHRRLRIDAEYRVMEACGWPFRLLGTAVRLATGSSLYAVVEVGVNP